APALGHATQDDGAHTRLVTHGHRQVGQLVAGGAVPPGDHHTVGRLLRQLPGLAAGGLTPEGLELVLELATLTEETFDPLRQLVGLDSEKISGASEQLLVLAQAFEAAFAG